MPKVDKAVARAMAKGDYEWRLSLRGDAPKSSENMAVSANLENALRGLDYYWPGIKIEAPENRILNVFVRDRYVQPRLVDDGNGPSAVVFMQKPKGKENVSYIFLTKPGANANLEDVTHDTRVMADFFRQRYKIPEMLGLPVMASAAVYAAIGIAAGVGLGELLRSSWFEAFEFSMTGRAAMDGVLGFCGGLGLSQIRGQLIYSMRGGLLARKAVAEMRRPDAYLFGKDAALAIKAEREAFAFERTAVAVHQDLTDLGYRIDKAKFYDAFKILAQNHGLQKAKALAAVTEMVPLDKIAAAYERHLSRAAPSAA